MVNRRTFLLRAAAAIAVVPLAPLLPKYATGGVISAPLAPALYGPASVVKLSAWLPVSVEMLEDIYIFGTAFELDGKLLRARDVLPA